MNIIKQFIETELENKVMDNFNLVTLAHNHPPLRFKVDGCEYCNKYGNIFHIE